MKKKFLQALEEALMWLFVVIIRVLKLELFVKNLSCKLQVTFSGECKGHPIHSHKRNDDSRKTSPLINHQDRLPIDSSVIFLIWSGTLQTSQTSIKTFMTTGFLQHLSLSVRCILIDSLSCFKLSHHLFYILYIFFPAHSRLKLSYYTKTQ